MTHKWRLLRVSLFNTRGKTKKGGERVMDFAGLTQIQAAAGGVDNRRCFVFILGATWE